MDDGSAGIGSMEIAIFFILLLAEMLLYGFASAVQNMKGREQEDDERKTDKKGRRLQYLIDHPAGYTNTMQLGIVTVNMLLGMLYLRRLHDYFTGFVPVWAGEVIGRTDPVIIDIFVVITAVLVTLILLYIVLTLGVLVPRKAASRYPKQWIAIGITPIYYFVLLASPFTWLLTALTKGILRLFGLKGLDEATDVTEEEILSLISEGHEKGILEASEAEMITNIIEYGEKEAKDIMVSRNNVIALGSNTTLKEAASFVIGEHHSRFPVYEETIDHIVGILHLKEILQMQMNEKMLAKPIGKIKGLLREPVFITETKKIDDLMNIMQAEKLQMVIVVDEYGQTAGLVALEDIIEEIVGNIQDEYDEEESYIQESGKDEYIIDGMTPLEELEEQLSISFEEEPFNTVNGFVISRLDHIPEEGEEFEFTYQGYLFRIQKVKDKMIQSVLALKIQEGQGKENNDAKVEETEEK